VVSSITDLRRCGCLVEGLIYCVTDWAVPGWSVAGDEHLGIELSNRLLAHLMALVGPPPPPRVCVGGSCEKWASASRRQCMEAGLGA
jgi:hypothetical protein